MTTIVELYWIAQAADDAYSAACLAAGYKSRWHTPAIEKEENGAVREAYQAKRIADELLHHAFVADRERARISRGCVAY